MSNYTKTTNFAVKDGLITGNPAKVVNGTEIDTEFNNIATAIGTKANSASPTLTGTITIGGVALTATGTELNYTDGVTSNIQTQLDAKQALDAGLTSIAGLTTAADKMIYTTASDTYAVADLSSFARTLLDDTTAGAARTTLGVTSANILPSYTGNASKGLAVNSGGTDVEWIALPGSGTVTSVNISGGTTGLTASGGPVTTSGTLTLGGTLAEANGGTGLTALGAGVATFLGTPSSANLSSAVTDETGSGALVFGTAPTISSPNITTALTLNGSAGTAGQVLKSAGAGNLPTWGGESSGLVLLSTSTPSSVASVSFNNLDTTYDSYEIRFQNVLPVTNADRFWIRLSADNGSTFISSASYFQNFIQNSAGTVSGNPDDGATKIVPAAIDVLNTSGTAAATGVSGIVRIHLPGTTRYQKIEAELTYVQSGTRQAYAVGAGNVDAGSGNTVTAIQFLFSTGNVLSGEFQVFGVRSTL